MLPTMVQNNHFLYYKLAILSILALISVISGTHLAALYVGNRHQDLDLINVPDIYVTFNAFVIKSNGQDK
jgi:hypothetical protein